MLQPLPGAVKPELLSSYLTPATTICVEQAIKRSRFITNIACTNSKASMQTMVSRIKQQHPDARHHCLAYIIGQPATSIERGCSDDGEPQGTAGKPMLNVLQHKKIGDITVVCSRFFGGIKLGAGGLVRAYACSAQQGIDALPLRRHVLTIPAQVILPFALESMLRHLLASHGISIRACDYQSHVILHIDIQQDQADILNTAIRDHSAGQASLHTCKADAVVLQGKHNTITTKKRAAEATR